MPHWLSHKLLRLLGVVTVTAIIGFLLLPVLERVKLTSSLVQDRIQSYNLLFIQS